MGYTTSFIFRTQGKRVSIPWFILFFVLAMIANTYLLTDYQQIGTTINGTARKCLTLTIFLIGASLSPDVLRQVGIRPLVQGVLLWIVISVAALAVVIM